MCSYDCYSQSLVLGRYTRILSIYPRYVVTCIAKLLNIRVFQSSVNVIIIDQVLLKVKARTAASGSKVRSIPFVQAECRQITL